MSQNGQQARYYPQVFDTASMADARNIILTDEGEGADTETRWALETPYLAQLIVDGMQTTESDVVVDYGCGVGRISKALIDKTNCFVVGVDISPQMRVLANEYVASERFVAVSPAQLDALSSSGFRASAAIAVWVFQHCMSPLEDIAKIKRSLARQAQLFVVNMYRRAVPAVIESSDERAQFLWASDDVDVATLLRSEFDVVGLGEPDRRQVPNMADAGAYWMRLRDR